jgi:hypothetical protein
MGLAFFDTCSRHPDETNRDFVLAERMAPFRGGIRRITPATFLRTFGRMNSLGAEWTSFDAACKEHGLDESLWRDHARPRSAPTELLPTPARTTATATRMA